MPHQVASWVHEQDREAAAPGADPGAQFRAVLVHDLKTPIRASRHLLQLIQEGADLERDVLRRYLEDLDESLQLVERRIESMLRLERTRHHVRRVERLDMGGIVHEAWSQVLRATASDKQIDVGPLPPCEGDPDLIQQVVTNLLENSVKYGEGTIRVRGAMRIEGAAYWICDDGPGIPEEWHDDVFAPFCRGPRRGPGGHGLGLAIVRHIVERHGGTVAIAPGPGFTVRFLLPSRRRSA